MNWLQNSGIPFQMISIYLTYRHYLLQRALHPIWIIKGQIWLWLLIKRQQVRSQVRYMFEEISFHYRRQGYLVYVMGRYATELVVLFVDNCHVIYDSSMATAVRCLAPGIFIILNLDFCWNFAPRIHGNGLWSQLRKKSLALSRASTNATMLYLLLAYLDSTPWVKRPRTRVIFQFSWNFYSFWNFHNHIPDFKHAGLDLPNMRKFSSTKRKIMVFKLSLVI